MPSDTSRLNRTVRELSGEIWAEMTIHIEDQELPVEVKHRIVDLITGVLARHVGEVIGKILTERPVLGPAALASVRRRWRASGGLAELTGGKTSTRLIFQTTRGKIRTAGPVQVLPVD
jgi:hypothetical protein